MIQIRLFTPEDYPAVVTVINTSAPEYPFTVETLQNRDETIDPRCHFARWVAVEGETVLGMAQYSQRIDMYHPQKFIVAVYVVPARQRQGIGTALYDTLTTHLERFDPIALHAWGREDRPADVHFWEQRGFVEEIRDGEAELRLADFDFAPFEAIERRIAEAGIALRSLVDLKDDPERDAKLTALHNILIQDIPPRGGRTPLDVETFVRLRLTRPGTILEAYLVAVSPEGEYIGVSALNRSPDGDPAALATGITGVHPEWRRRGIALALKLRALRYAREQGVAIARTSNASSNDPILSLNASLGFQRLPWRIHFVLTPERT